MKKILAVDNDRFMLKFISDVISKEGHKVLIAEDGLSALDILETYTPDVIFIDLVMPNINGKKLCKIIRGMQKLKHSCIIILSAVAAEEETDFAKLGANGCIAKGPLEEMAQNITSVVDQYDRLSSQHLPKPLMGIESLHPRGITEELLSVKRHFEIILEKMSEGILEITSKGRIVYANPTALSLIGMSEKELLGSHFIKLFDEDDHQRIDELLKTMGDKPVTITEDLPVNLNEYQVTLSILPINERPSTTIVILNDVTERKRSEKSLKETNKFLRNILDSSSSISIMSTDLDQNILFWNKGAENLFGYKSEEVVGIKKTGMLYPGDEEKALVEDIRSLIRKNKKAITCEIREVSKDGRKLWINLNLTPRFDEKGNVVGILGIGEDISERKRLEAQLQQAQKMEAIGTLTSGVAHNFRNILAGISMDSQLLQMKYGDNPKMLEISERISRGIKRGTQLIEGLMQFSRKQPKERLQSLNLSDVIHEAYQLISKSFDKRVDIRADIPESLPIMGDHSELSQVFMNLFNNARDAMPEGGKLTIEAEKEKNNVLVIISDTGHGMDKETQVKCFDPFFTTKEGKKGTGLGLSTTYGIVKEHEGKINVHSEPSKGTTFKLSFPLAIAGEQIEHKAETGTVKGRGEKILLVDDESVVIEPMHQLLDGLGYDVTSVSSGKDAIAKYKSWKPDAVLMDRNMPEMDGITCAEKILEFDPEAKIIMVSGYDEEGPNGIDDRIAKAIKGYLTKPINMAQLTTLMADLLK
jgi:PAS domain S-box-containing protein